MAKPENSGSTVQGEDTYRLTDPLEDYLLAKSKTDGTGNYRRNAERVVKNWIKLTSERRDVQTFRELRTSDLESYAFYLKRRTNASDGTAASTARKYYDYVRAYLS